MVTGRDFGIAGVCDEDGWQRELEGSLEDGTVDAEAAAAAAALVIFL